MKEYNHAEIEKKWQDYWEANKTFKIGEPKKQKFYCLDMFPYPSGSGLHIGHPLGYSATDIYCRYKRMKDFDVLHPMGYDAFGLPAEQHAVNTGEHPALITRDNCEHFTKQMKTIGLSYDWDREVRSCDEDYYKWTQWIFLKIYNSWFDEDQQKARPIEELPIPDSVDKNDKKAVEVYRADHRLAFYADAMVNWCPALGTVLANEEVIDGRSERGGHEVIRKPMKQWMLRITKYSERLLEDLEEIDWPDNIKEQQRNWIGKNTGTEIDFPVVGSYKRIPAFTTRPDTLFGVTFFVVSPEHPIVEELTTDSEREKVKAYCEESMRVSEFMRTIENREKTGVFTGSYIRNPINDEEVPIYVGDYVLMSYGTGAVMGVPMHDERDFQFAKKYSINVRPLLIPEEGDKDYIEKIKAGEVAYTKPGVMLPSEFKVANELKLEGIQNEEAKQRITGWLVEDNYGREVVNYKLRDWLFSRQRYWGEPIPVVHWEDGISTALDESELPLVLPEVKNYKPSESGESPLARATEWLEVTDPNTGMKGRRETNTMPQWAGSCWYYLRFIDPQNEKVGWDPKLEKAWMPIDLYVGGAEHAVLHLLYARFWHKVLYDLGHVSTNEPFKKLFNQGMILAHAYKNKRGALVPIDKVEEKADGTAVVKESGEEVERIVAKMSKSLRNVINPDDIMHEYGADTLRLYLMFMGPLDSSRVWDQKAISGVFRFLRKSWTLVTDEKDTGFREVVDANSESDEVKKALHASIKKLGEDLEDLQFNTAISALMEFVNTATGKDVSKETLSTFTLLLSPLAPHLAEELWERLGNSNTLAYEEWPVFNPDFLTEDTVTVVIQVNGKKRGEVNVSSNISDDDLRQEVITAMANTSYPVDNAKRFIPVRNPKTSAPKLMNVVL